MIARLRALLEHRAAPAVAGALTALVIWWVWGSLAQTAAYHDEAAYVLQAKLFASGRWTGPGRPLPEFFEQYHVIVTPVLAAKYWPGHSLLMVPGMWLGLPGLVPVLLSGLTGGLCFALARRVAGPWVAAPTWFFWLTAPGNLDYRASYFSEVTTGALWLLGWWLLLDWQATGRRRSLVALAACVGFGAVTRPLTMLAFAVPVGVVVVRRTFASGKWRDFSLALGWGAALLAIIPLWSARTTGDWRTTPYREYTRLYMPFDRVGFGLDTTPPLLPASADLSRWIGEFHEVQRHHTLAALPLRLAWRLHWIGDDMWHGWRALLLPAALLGLFVLPAGTGIMVVASTLLVVLYASFAHPDRWTLYYVELQPILALVSVLGARRLVSRLPSLAIGLVCVAVLPFVGQDIAAARRAGAARRADQSAFAALVQRIPARRAIVFVRYGPRHSNAQSLITNPTDLEAARTWIVLDRGADDARLTALAPDRAPYVYDEATRTLTPWKPPSP